MKKITTTLACLLLIAQGVLATTYTVTISGFAYSPASLNASVGDVITISAGTTHPLVQVDQTNWNANTPTPVSGGWGIKTAAYTFTLTSAGTIYYGCQNHMASMQMKGQINVTATGIKQITASGNKALLYPNPVINGEFTVKMENQTGNGKVIIYNMEGKLLESYTLTAGVAEIKTKLPAGEYFYSVTINQKEGTREKFVVMNK